ncbi:hypothetical protein [Ferruginibacter sp. SUN106]|uniref:hypothetical protein n=1 Tax=Ferruginibacter sp. SUN106 TaxID=2978348 RepID=UPI003D35C355
MQPDLVFFDDAILLSKETRDSSVWQNKLLYYKTCLHFNNSIALLDYLTLHYKLTAEDLQIINRQIADDSTTAFVIRFSNDTPQQITITNTSLAFLSNPGALVYWNEWDWVLRKENDDFYLWAYAGGIAEMAREIKLSSEQKNNFLLLGRSFIKTLAAQLQLFQSAIYEDAVKENRKTI